MVSYKQGQSSNYERFNFIDVKGDTLRFKSGTYVLDETLNIPGQLEVYIEPNFKLDFKNNASLISKSPITALGTVEAPITFFSADATGGGIFITNANKESVLTHCIFDNLSNPNSPIWSVSGLSLIHI